ncbi:MAG: hypothetical protein LBT25_04870 [Candidatus Symbiothrix sp.]|jgi:hypothetical protein|nr:hypothetical protein [Candidatus Symbiothrix sp.]
MTTITLSFDERNPFAKKTMDYILSLGLFFVPSSKHISKEGKIERELTPEEEKTAFLYTSKVNTSKIIAKYLE